MIIEEKDYLAHFGILRKSGRYPWGSGKDPQSRGREFNRMMDELTAAGMSGPEIAKALGFVNEKTGQPSTTMLRQTRSIANNAIKAADMAMAYRLKEKGVSDAEGARQMGIPGTNYRELLVPANKDKVEKLASTATMLRDQVKERTIVQVGSGVENYLGVSTSQLSNAVAVLKDEGYMVHKVPVPQLGTGKTTQVKVLCPPGMTWGEAKKRQDEIQLPGNWSDDNGLTFPPKLQYPLSINPSRVKIMYKEDGGDKQDGMIYLRPGVKDISLQNSRYAQVRVLVGDSHYLKGMAIYKDDLPPGTDILFATAKSNKLSKLEVMKPLKDETPIQTNNPFGSSLKRQITERDADGKEKLVSAMNIVNEQGDWEPWSRSLSSQVLSKQSPALAKTQLDLTFDRKQKELDTILKLTNPTVRRKLLESFGDETDAAAVHLEAVALNTRQAYHIILPITTMPPHQVYAPRYKNGEIVALIRFPHGGTFEIPELVVNNNHPEAKRLLGDVPDAIGIHHSVAERLSGADFDGDQVVVIPNGGAKKIRSTPALEKLKDFDPRAAYPEYPGMKVISASHKGIEMGIVSNLITDMTIQKAPPDEIAQAIRHSMVVIDSENHKLNYKQSAIDNGIPNLKKKYQQQPDSNKAGAATLISRAGSEVHLPAVRARRVGEGGPIDPVTGRKMTVPTGATRLNKKGERVPVTERHERLAITDDAHTLLSKGGVGTPIERVYADHSNRLKELANTSRKELLKTPSLKREPSAARAYAKEVDSLNHKLSLAISNRPLERQAQVVGNAIYRARLESNPNLDNASKRKLRFQALQEGRTRVGAESQVIKIEPPEWDAIQAGAISDSKLRDILRKADLDIVRELATPKPQRLMSSTKVTRARRLLASGNTRAQVAEALGVSLSTLDEAMNG